MKKQTAVEWLVDELRNQIEAGTLDAIAISKLKMQAKAMEREQIEHAFDVGYGSGSDAPPRKYPELEYHEAFEYYNETYK